jgi:DDE superfamily endonuclease
MTRGKQQKIFHKGSNRKINAFVTLLHPSNKIKFKISKSRTSTDFIDHLKNIRNYVKKNKIKRFMLITDNATFHVSRKTQQFTHDQSGWLTVMFLPKRSPNLNPVETRINRNLKKDVCANHDYGTEDNLRCAVRRYLRCMGSWPKL